MFSSLYSPLLGLDPGKRPCFEPYTLGRSLTAMYNRNVPTYNTILATNAAQTPVKCSSTSLPHVLKMKNRYTWIPWVSAVLQAQGTDTASENQEELSGGCPQVKEKTNSSFFSESLNALDNEESVSKQCQMSIFQPLSVFQIMFLKLLTNTWHLQQVHIVVEKDFAKILDNLCCYNFAYAYGDTDSLPWKIELPIVSFL